MSFRACKKWTISLRPIKAQRLLRKLPTGLRFLSWFGRDGRVEKKSGCVWTSLSLCAKMKLEQQTHRRDMTEVSGTSDTQKRTERRGRVSISSADLEFSVRMNPPGHTDSIVCMLTARVLLWKTESGRACADDSTRWGFHCLGCRVALCPLIVRCADSCQEMETASGWVKQLKLPCHVFYMSADEDGMEKTLISLSDRAHKAFGWGWIYFLFLIVTDPLTFPWQVSSKCYETAAAVCNVETTSHQGTLWLPCFLLRGTRSASSD